MYLNKQTFTTLRIFFILTDKSWAKLLLPRCKHCIVQKATISAIIYHNTAHRDIVLSLKKDNFFDMHFSDWPYRDKLNQALLELQEAGILSKMKLKWWNEVGTSGCSVSNFKYTNFTIV